MMSIEIAKRQEEQQLQKVLETKQLRPNDRNQKLYTHALNQGIVRLKLHLIPLSIHYLPINQCRSPFWQE